jgi:hypothetical protein
LSDGQVEIILELLVKEDGNNDINLFCTFVSQIKQFGEFITVLPLFTPISGF